MLDSTMVEHSFWEKLADAAPFDPENVQLVALLSTKFGAGVITGSATGFAMA